MFDFLKQNIVFMSFVPIQAAHSILNFVYFNFDPQVKRILREQADDEKVEQFYNRVQTYLQRNQSDAALSGFDFSTVKAQLLEGKKACDHHTLVQIAKDLFKNLDIKGEKLDKWQHKCQKRIVSLAKSKNFDRLAPDTIEIKKLAETLLEEKGISDFLHQFLMLGIKVVVTPDNGMDFTAVRNVLGPCLYVLVFGCNFKNDSIDLKALYLICNCIYEELHFNGYFDWPINERRELNKIDRIRKGLDFGMSFDVTKQFPNEAQESDPLNPKAQGLSPLLFSKFEELTVASDEDIIRLTLKGDLKALKKIVNQNNVNTIKGVFERNLLQLATIIGHDEVVDFFLTLGADTEYCDRLNRNVVHYSVKHLRVSVLFKVLQGTNANMLANQPDKYMKCPLHLLAEHRKDNWSKEHLQILEALTDAQAQFFKADKSGMSPMKIARQNCIDEFFQNALVERLERNKKKYSLLEF